MDEPIELMEEKILVKKILEIMNGYNTDANNGQMWVITEDSYCDVAKEIDILTRNHYMKFIEWLCFDDKSHYRCGAGWRIGQGIKEHNINEVYQYWVDIKLKM